MSEISFSVGAELTPALLTQPCFADRSVNGRLWVTGEDALDLLNRLSTNQLESLPDHTGTSTVLTNGDGRVIDLLNLGAVDNGLWCITSPGLTQTVTDWLDAYTFGEAITVLDRTADTFDIALVGPGAQQALTEAGASIEDLGINRLQNASIAGIDVLVWHRLVGGAEGYELIGADDEATLMMNALESAGAQAISRSEWESYRIAAGMPVAGAEFGLFTNPLEARLLGAISDNKGCYTGQEIIARLQTYSKVQRRLMAINLEGPAQTGAQLLSNGVNAGQLTSVSQVGKRNIGLALVAAKFAFAGATLDIAVDGQMVQATLLDPFYAVQTEPSPAL